jgi:hypothetical protein
MATDVRITSDSKIGIKGVDGGDHVHVDINYIDPLRISQVQKIAPVAVHIKEVNHIDPISVEALNVSEVRNIDPIKVEKFSVTNLPMVNMSLRQLPPLDMNIRKLPPLSVGTHQDFHVPSDYTVSGRLLGIEFFRIRIDGCTNIIPRERFRQEQERVPGRSFPVPAAGGNKAIPSVCRETSVSTMRVSSCRHDHKGFKMKKDLTNFHRGNYGSSVHTPSPTVEKRGSISFGMPHTNFYMPGTETRDTMSESSVSSGD